MDPSEEITFKIKFIACDPNSGSTDEGICYVDYDGSDSSFKLRSVESCNAWANTLKIDILRPGRYG